mgnify:CR=1 FL=1
MNRCRVFIADHRWLTRRGLRATLSAWEGFEVVGEAADVPACVARALDLKPHIVLMDDQLGGEGGVAGTRLLKERCPQVRVLLLSERTPDTVVREALRAGSDGCLRKDAGEAELREAVQSVRDGRVYLDAEMTRQLVLAEHRRETQSTAHPLDCLSPRELTVFRLVAEGHTNRSTGKQMQLSPKTVEKYRASLMQKLRLHSAVDLRLLALELGVRAEPSDATAASLAFA